MMSPDKVTEDFLALVDGFQRVIFDVGNAQDLAHGKAGESGAWLDIDVPQIGNAMMFVLSQFAAQDGSMPAPADRQGFTDRLAKLFHDHYRTNEGLLADVKQRGLHANDR